jgi:predicted outer membrane protein
MTRTPRTLLAIPIAIALLGGCHRDADDANADANADANSAATDAMATDPSAMDAPTPTPSTDGSMATGADGPALIAAIDQHEIDAAGLAATKATRADVKEYAAMLDTEHRANLEQARALPGGTTTDSPALADLMQKGRAEMDKLRAADGASFDTTYLDSMVAGHTDALNLIDSQLLPGAQDPAVVDFLTRTREAVSKHLDRARALQAAAP